MEKQRRQAPTTIQRSKKKGHDADNSFNDNNEDKQTSLLAHSIVIISEIFRRFGVRLCGVYVCVCVRMRSCSVKSKKR